MREHVSGGIGVFSQVVRRMTVAVVAAGLVAIASSGFAAASQLRLVTFNVDFNNNATQIDADIQAVKPQADIIFFQETKWVNIANSFPGTAWDVYQVTNQGDAKKGSALAIRRSARVALVNTGLVLGVDSNGEDMLDRYIAWADVKLNNNLVIRVMSLHMPPQRFRYLQPIMADNMASFIAGSPYPAVVGADWNFIVTNDPHGIQADTGMVPKGVGIDGFFYDPAVTSFVSVAALNGLNVNSDHAPVRMVANFDVPTYIVDNSQAGFSASGTWQSGTSAADKYGSNYRFRNTQAVSDAATWTANVTAGSYKVYAWWSQGANRSASAPYILPGGQSVSVNQQSNGGKWNLLGSGEYSGATQVGLSCWTTTGFVVMADAIKLGP